VQLVWGTRDTIFREDSIERFRALWPQATVARIADANHFLQYEAAEELAAVLKPWLGRI